MTLRTALEAADELEAFAGFYGAQAARCFYGDHVCLAAQPDDANGSVEDLVERGVGDTAAITGAWADAIAEAVHDRTTPGSVLTVLGGLELDLTPFARIVERELVQGAMLGALDSEWERTHDEEIAPARFAAAQAEGAFSSLPYADAVRIFNEKKVLPKAAFDALEKGARRTAFTVARMASADMLNTTKGELARVLNESRRKSFQKPDGTWVNPGPNLRDFRRFAKERLESAGWTPANKSHVETIYRTNVVGGYASGRFVEQRKPEVLALLPYWQIRGVNDDRARPTHKAAFGIVLPADSPFWLHAYPPFGYNCRCRVISRSKRWLETSGTKIGPVPKGLPDPGFDSGTHRLISVPPAALEPPKLPVQPHPVKPPVPPWMHPPLTPAAEPLPPPLPPPVPIVEPTVLPPPPPPVVLEPLPPPPPVHEPPPIASSQNILGKKLAEATGSNPGGVYEGLDGKKRYVKFYQDPAQAIGEKVANELYGALGFGKLTSTTFENGGQLAYASELLPGVKTIEQAGLTPERAKKALEGFAADVLLANWDAAGLTLDNLVVAKGGKIVRIDNGGALLSRAKAGRKPQSALHNVTEWEKFFDPNVNPGYSKLAQAAGVTSAEELGASLEKGIKKILALKKKSGGWGQFVLDHAGPATSPLAKQDQQQMALMLEERTAFLEKKLKALKAPKPPPGTREWEHLKTGRLPPTRTQPIEGVSHTKWLSETGSRFRSVVPHDGVQAIEAFTGSGYGSIRKAARLTEEEYVQASGAAGTGEQTARAKYRENRAKAEAIERAFAAAEPGAPYSHVADLTELYRGIGGLSEQVFNRMIAAKEAVFAAPASTSWRASVAESFADRQGGHKIVFVFRPKEQFAARRLAVDAVSSVGTSEAEVLTRTGSSWRVTDVVRKADESGPNKFAIVYLEETEALAEPAGAAKLRAPSSSTDLITLQTS